MPPSDDALTELRIMWRENRLESDAALLASGQIARDEQDGHDDPIGAEMNRNLVAWSGTVRALLKTIETISAWDKVGSGYYQLREIFSAHDDPAEVVATFMPTQAVLERLAEGDASDLVALADRAGAEPGISRVTSDHAKMIADRLSPIAGRILRETAVKETMVPGS